MATSRVNSATLVLALIAGLVVLHETQNLFTSLAGLTLLVVLFAFERTGERSGMQSFAFALACGLALLCTCSYPFSALLPALGLSTAFIAQYFPAIFWLLGTGIFWAVDRSGADSGAPQPVSFTGGYSQPATALKPTFETRPFTPAPVVSTPEPELEPVYSTAVSAPSPVAMPVPSTVSTPPASTAPAPAPPVLTGKEVNIYVTMMGEGMNVLRSVRAEHLGRDFYIIVDEMPTDENWEFAPGQVVRCKKKNLSNGKGLVAFEEAPRAQ